MRYRKRKAISGILMMVLSFTSDLDKKAVVRLSFVRAHTKLQCVDVGPARAEAEVEGPHLNCPEATQCCVAVQSTGRPGRHHTRIGQRSRR